MLGPSSFFLFSIPKNALVILSGARDSARSEGPRCFWHDDRRATARGAKDPAASGTTIGARQRAERRTPLLLTRRSARDSARSEGPRCFWHDDRRAIARVAKDPAAFGTTIGARQRAERRTPLLLARRSARDSARSEGPRCFWHDDRRATARGAKDPAASGTAIGARQRAERRTPLLLTRRSARDSARSEGPRCFWHDDRRATARGAKDPAASGTAIGARQRAERRTPLLLTRRSARDSARSEGPRCFWHDDRRAIARVAKDPAAFGTTIGARQRAERRTPLLLTRRSARDSARSEGPRCFWHDDRRAIARATKDPAAFGTTIGARQRAERRTPLLLARRSARDSARSEGPRCFWHDDRRATARGAKDPAASGTAIGARQRAERRTPLLLTRRSARDSARSEGPRCFWHDDRRAIARVAKDPAAFGTTIGARQRAERRTPLLLTRRSARDSARSEGPRCFWHDDRRAIARATKDPAAFGTTIGARQRAERRTPLLLARRSARDSARSEGPRCFWHDDRRATARGAKDPAASGTAIGARQRAERRTPLLLTRRSARDSARSEGPRCFWHDDRRAIARVAKDPAAFGTTIGARQRAERRTPLLLTRRSARDSARSEGPRCFWHDDRRAIARATKDPAAFGTTIGARQRAERRTPLLLARRSARDSARSEGPRCFWHDDRRATARGAKDPAASGTAIGARQRAERRTPLLLTRRSARDSARSEGPRCFWHDDRRAIARVAKDPAAFGTTIGARQRAERRTPLLLTRRSARDSARSEGPRCFWHDDRRAIARVAKDPAAFGTTIGARQRAERRTPLLLARRSARDSARSEGPRCFWHDDRRATARGAKDPAASDTAIGARQRAERRTPLLLTRRSARDSAGNEGPRRLWHDDRRATARGAKDPAASGTTIGARQRAERRTPLLLARRSARDSARSEGPRCFWHGDRRATARGAKDPAASGTTIGARQRAERRTPLLLARRSARDSARSEGPRCFWHDDRRATARGAKDPVVLDTKVGSTGATGYLVLVAGGGLG